LEKLLRLLLFGVVPGEGVKGRDVRREVGRRESVVWRTCGLEGGGGKRAEEEGDWTVVSRRPKTEFPRLCLRLRDFFFFLLLAAFSLFSNPSIPSAPPPLPTLLTRLSLPTVANPIVVLLLLCLVLPSVRIKSWGTPEPLKPALLLRRGFAGGVVNFDAGGEEGGRTPSSNDSCIGMETPAMNKASARWGVGKISRRFIAVASLQPSFAPRPISPTNPSFVPSNVVSMALPALIEF